MIDLDLSGGYVLDAVDNYDYEHFRSMKWYRNRTRFYNWIACTLSGGVEVHTIAVKTARDKRGIVAKDVFRADVDGDTFETRDLININIYGYLADWSAEGLGNMYYAPSARGKWAEAPYLPGSTAWKIACPTINPEELQLTERFRYCAYSDNYSDRLIDYLKMYVVNPRIELLAKAGLRRLCCKSSLVKKINSDGQFRAFFLKNLDEIRDARCGVDSIFRSYKKQITMREANKEIGAIRALRGCEIPDEVGKLAAGRYISTHHVAKHKYEFYLRACVELGFNLADTKVAFPRDFNGRHAAISEMIHAKRIADDKKKRAAESRQIRSTANRYAAIERIKRGAFRATLPRTRREFADEGKALGHCVGNGCYATRVASGKSVICFVRMSEDTTRPFVTLEYSPEEKRIMQCYAKENSKPSKAVDAWINKCLLPKLAAV